MRTTIISVLFASLVLSGCAAQSAVEPDDDFVAAEAKALTASDLYNSLVGGYTSKETVYPRFTLNADRSYELDTGIRCVTTPCPSGEAGRWTLYTYKGSFYLNLASKTSSRWFWVKSFKSATLVNVDDKTVWNKIVEEPKPAGCAATLCATGTFCVEEAGVAQCITKCATVKCTSTTYCDASSGSATCVAYACPKAGTINCMPMVPEANVKYCSGQLHEWIIANCKGTSFVY